MTRRSGGTNRPIATVPADQDTTPAAGADAPASGAFAGRLDEFRLLESALRSIGRDEITHYKLFSTRQLLTKPQLNLWQSYVRGTKLTGDAEEQAYQQRLVRTLTFSSSMEDAALTRYRLDHVLEEMDISVEKAGKVFINQIRAVLNLQEPNEPSTALMKQSTPAVAVQRLVPVAGSALEGGAAEVREKSALRLQIVIRFLERQIAQARHYADYLVEPLTRYLLAAQELAGGVGTSQPPVGEPIVEQGSIALTMDELATFTSKRTRHAAEVQIAQHLIEKLDPHEIVGYLSAAPVYVHRGQDENGTPLGTVLIPKFQNEKLDSSYQWFWNGLLQVARQQAVIPFTLSGEAPATDDAVQRSETTQHIEPRRAEHG